MFPNKGSIYGQTSITDIRWGFHATYIKIVFEFDAPVKYDFTKAQKNKFRFFGCKAGSETDKNIKINNLLVKDISLNQIGKDLIADINLQDTFKSKEPYILKNPYRVVYEVLYEREEVNNHSLGLEYEKKGDYQQALTYYRKAVRENPGDHASYFRAGILRFKIGDLDKALINFKQIPDNSEHKKAADEYIDIIQDQLTGANKVNAETEKTEEDKPELEKTAVEDKSEDTPKLTQPQKEEKSFLDLNDKTKDKDTKSQFSSLVDVSNFYLYIFISFAALFLLLIIILIRKYFSLKKEQKTYQEAIIKETPEAKRKESEENERKRIDFTKKLIEVYQATEKSKIGFEESNIAAKKTPQPANHEYTDWNKKIDNILKEENETIKLTKMFQDKGDNRISGDKYEAVYELLDKNWEVKDIARELNLGIEEVKLALNMRSRNKVSNIVNRSYDDIYRLADLKVSPQEIARRLDIGHDEVNLALELRRKSIGNQD